MTTIFTNTNFHIGSWVINSYNGIGLLLIGLTLLIWFLTLFGVSNLSREDGYLLFLEERKEKGIENWALISKSESDDDFEMQCLVSEVVFT